MFSLKVVLAYSGGLDTTIILHWLVYQKGYDVIAYTSFIGQKDFKPEVIKKRAKHSGANKIIIEDLRRQLAEDYAWKAINSDAVYEDNYLLGTAIARPLIASNQVKTAKKYSCSALAHGATGKGNDQVRFELTYKVLMPEANIISPWKDAEFLKEFSSRSDMLRYAEKNGLDLDPASRSYSIDDNLLHISHEGGILEDPANLSYPMLTKNSTEIESKIITVQFERGVPKTIEADGAKVSDPVEMFNLLNDLSDRYSFGIADIVENRYIGIKSRGVYYQGAMEIFHKAHITLEATLLDKKTFHHKLTLGRIAGELIYEGRWFSRYLQNLFSYCSAVNSELDGEVKILLRPNSFSVVGRKPNNKKIHQKLKNIGSFSMNNYNPLDAIGFINIASIEDSW